MKRIAIYIEGGGKKRETKLALREGFAIFLGELKSAARRHGIEMNLVISGSRSNAYRNFRISIRDKPEAHSLLLIDAEGPVQGTPWQHLKRQDGWDSHVSPDETCHLMTECMEAWFLADPDALAEYFGSGFNKTSLGPPDNVETVAKKQVFERLSKALQATKKRRGYDKGRDAPRILARISPLLVRKRAKIHGKRLFATLAKLVGADLNSK